MVEEIAANLRARGPDLDPAWVVAEPVSTFADLLRAMEPADIVVATRYQTWCARSCCPSPPSPSGTDKERGAHGRYGTGRVLPVGRLPGFGRLIEQFSDVESQTARLRQAITEGNAAKAPLVQSQLAELSAMLFRSSAQAPGSRWSTP